MDPTGIPSINSTKIRYQSGKANILADALPGRRREELARSEATEAEGNPKQQITVITSIVLTEEIQLWKEAQKEDPEIQAIVQQLKNIRKGCSHMLKPLKGYWYLGSSDNKNW